MRKLIAIGLFLNAGLLGLLTTGVWQIAQGGGGETGGTSCSTLNGDANGDGMHDVSDPVYLLNWLFADGPDPVALCEPAGGGFTPKETEAIREVISSENLEMLRRIEFIPTEPAEGEGVAGQEIGGTIVFEGVNVQITNGMDDTATTNGFGNLIVGYNESIDDNRTGSHNIVVGDLHTYTSHSGLVTGLNNAIVGAASAVTSGIFNLAIGDGSSVSGGVLNAAVGNGASVSGGENNIANGDRSSVSGGKGLVADNDHEHLPAASGPPEVEGFTFVETNATTGLHEYTHDQTGIEFVLLPGGVFNMGSPDDEVQRDSDEGPVHPVNLSPFLCAKYEVTQAQWVAVMGSNPSEFTGDDSRPVEAVSWDDIQDFERRTGLVLPTEAQWEYACRAGQAGPYSGAGNLDDMGWYFINSGNTTHPVGQKAPNQFGLYDMHGNVFEWCEDVYNAAFYTTPIVNGTAPGNAALDPLSLTGSGARVIRGGGFDLGARYCRSADRNGGPPSSRAGFLGFRPVRSSISP